MDTDGSTLGCPIAKRCPRYPGHGFHIAKPGPSFSRRCPLPKNESSMSQNAHDAFRERSSLSLIRIKIDDRI
jgi:hypothetical protein